MSHHIDIITINVIIVITDIEIIDIIVIIDVIDIINIIVCFYAGQKYISYLKKVYLFLKNEVFVIQLCHRQKNIDQKSLVCLKNFKLSKIPRFFKSQNRIYLDNWWGLEVEASIFWTDCECPIYFFFFFFNIFGIWVLFTVYIIYWFLDNSSHYVNVFTLCFLFN